MRPGSWLYSNWDKILWVVNRVKFNSDEFVEWHKGRLVRFGNHQEADIDYHETLSLVVNPSTICLVLSLALTFGWSIRQLDVKNAFLHDILVEEVCIKQPPRFVY